MANEHKIEINKRAHITRQGLKQLRREKNIPGIYYSTTSKDSIPIFITQKDYYTAIKSGARIFNILVDNKKQNVLFKSVQYSQLFFIAHGLFFQTHGVFWHEIDIFNCL